MEDNMEIKMKIKSFEYTVNGVKKYLVVAPFIKNGRTMLPVRDIVEAFDCQINWNPLTQEVTITK